MQNGATKATDAMLQWTTANNKSKDLTINTFMYLEKTG